MLIEIPREFNFGKPSPSLINPGSIDVLNLDVDRFINPGEETTHETDQPYYLLLL